MLSFIFNEAMRDLRRAGRVGISAILLIALSLTALGGFWLLSLNLGRAIDQWGDRVRVIVYLKDEPPAAQARGSPAADRGGGRHPAPALRVQGRGAARAQALARQPGRRGRPAAAQPAARVRRGDARRGDRHAGGHPRAGGTARPLPEVEEVQGGSQWVDGLAQFRRLFQGMGLVVGAVLALAAILTVTTATTLVLHLRRDEMEIMRLVGATESVIRWPRLLQGMAQGLLAAIVALATLEIAYAVAVPRLEPLLPVTHRPRARRPSSRRCRRWPSSGPAPCWARWAACSPEGARRHDRRAGGSALALAVASALLAPAALGPGAQARERGRDRRQAAATCSRPRSAPRGAAEGGRRAQARGGRAERAEGIDQRLTRSASRWWRSTRACGARRPTSRELQGEIGRLQTPPLRAGGRARPAPPRALQAAGPGRRRCPSCSPATTR